MKILISLPIEHQKFNSIDDILSETIGCSGTDGSIIRLAKFLAESGFDVCLSAASSIQCTSFSCIQHKFVNAANFDRLIVHQSHWDGVRLTFGNQFIAKTFLWLHNQISQALVHTFLLEGGNRIICPSFYHANVYRALPQWTKKVVVIYNSYSPAFIPSVSPSLNQTSRPRLLFVGALTRSKGFVELTKIWSFLVNKGIDLELSIAGSSSIHKDNNLGSMGLAESELEINCIQPWLKSLPKEYQPHLLGNLSPLKLRNELAKSWAVIVNPGGVPETFCVSAVEAQACERTVFSVENGALKETIYCGKFNSLVKPHESIGQRIIEGLSHKELVDENGIEASQFVRNKFQWQSIGNTWIRLLSGQDIKLKLPNSWDNSRELVCDLMRWSNTGLLINSVRNPEVHQVIKTYKNYKRQIS